MDRLKLTEAMERAKLREIAKAYQDAYNEVKRKITDFLVSHIGDKELSLAEMSKYGRMLALEKGINAELAKLTILNAGSLEAYAKSVYELNYFYTGYMLEIQSQMKLAFGGLNTSAIKAAIENPLDKIASLSAKEQLRAKVKSALVQGIIQGKSVPKIARAIRDVMQKSASNAERIVRTETTRCMNAGNLDSMEWAKAHGLPIKKTWIASLDNRTRSSHAHLDGETVDIDKPFKKGLSVPLMYPGDPAGNADDVINCRCTLIETIDFAGMPEKSRRAKEDGEYSIIPNTTFEEWRKTRVG